MLIKKFTQIILLLSTVAVLPMNAQTKNSDKKLEGLWLFKGQTLQGSSFQPNNMGIYKAIMDNKFISFVTGKEKAAVTSQGSIYFDTDSTFTETASFPSDPYRKSERIIRNRRT